MKVPDNDKLLWLVPLSALHLAIYHAEVSQANEGLKFYFQGISPQCIANAVELLQKDHTLRPVVEVHLAEKVFSPFGIDPSLLTPQAVGDFRNEELSAGKRIMLLGPPDDSEWDTVRMMKLFGEEQMMEADGDWVAEFAPDHLPDDQKSWWRAALRGLDGLAFARLEEFAAFVVRTRTELDAGVSLTVAIGNSLPALGHRLFSLGCAVRGAGASPRPSRLLDAVGGLRRESETRVSESASGMRVIKSRRHYAFRMTSAMMAESWLQFSCSASSCFRPAFVRE